MHSLNFPFTSMGCIMKWMPVSLAGLMVLCVCTHGAPAWAQGTDLPTPIIFKADPQMVYPNSPGWLDSNGRIPIILSGDNLSPDADLGHPAGPDGGYQHIYIRGVSPHGDRATAWVPATADNGCQVYGGAAQTVIFLGIDPNHFLSEPGSHLQVKLWVAFTPTSASEPSGSGVLHSDWSAIKTIDVALAGVSKPVEAPPAKEIPTISRMSPSSFVVTDRSANYRIRIYGQHLCGDHNVVIFNGDVAGAVPAEDHCKGVDDDGTFLKGSEAVFHVTIPEKYRLTKPGQLTVMVNNGEGNSTSRPITFNALNIKPTGRPPIPLAMGPLQLTTSTVTAKAPQGLGKATPVSGTSTSVANPAPAITRLSTTEFALNEPAASYRIRLYGRNLSAPDTKVVFGGDLAGAVAPEDASKATDDDGTALKGGEVVFHVTIPERYRRAGQVTVAVVNAQGRSDNAQISFRGAVDLRKPVPVVPPVKPVVQPTAPIKRP